MSIVRTVNAEGVCLLGIERADSSGNLLDVASLGALEQQLAFVADNAAVRGVVLSGKPNCFSAGADLRSFAPRLEEKSWHEMANLGHRVLRRLSELRVPSVAAIDGPCVGGGLELALACDWRVASLGNATRLALPQTRRGLLPAWGGCARLPQLIGLPAAIELIATGREIDAETASRLGVVDELAHVELLFETAGRLLARGRRPAPAPRWRNTPPFSQLIGAGARAALRRRILGLSSAALSAIRVCTTAAAATLDEALAAEKDALLEVVRTRESRHLLQVFLHEQRVRARKAEVCFRPQRAAVIGAGATGVEIVPWLAREGTAVLLHGAAPAALARALHETETAFAAEIQTGALGVREAESALDRIQPLHVPVPLCGVELAVEAEEKFPAKQRALRELEQRAPAQALLASALSGVSLEALASGLQRPERLVGLHVFDPVLRVPLVEIVRGPRTDAAVVARAVDLVTSLGKLPLVVKDGPGFLVHRILLPCLVEAVWMFTEGARVAAIDRAVLELGWAAGPLRLADELGLDRVQLLARDLERRLPGAIPVADTLDRMIAKGWLGKKSGRGFYVWKGDRARVARETRGLQAERPRARDAATQRDRLVLIMVNEAARAWAEEIVEAPDEVDFGLVHGGGWPAHHGGPLRYADARGIADVVRRLESLALDIAPHFAPCERLCEMAAEGSGFYTPRIHARPKRASAAPPKSVPVPAAAPAVPLYPDSILAD